MQDKAFWEIFFQLSTSRYTKSSILDVRLRSEYASGTAIFPKDYILDVWVGFGYASDMFKERQKLPNTCKGVIFKNFAAKTNK